MVLVSRACLIQNKTQKQRVTVSPIPSQIDCAAPLPCLELHLWYDHLYLYTSVMREIRVHPPGTDLQRIVEPKLLKSAPPVQVRLSVSSNQSNCDRWFGPIAVHVAR